MDDRNVDSKAGDSVTAHVDAVETPRNEKSARKNAGAKKPYRKPSFQHERVFETMALACGKLNPTQGQCRFNRKNS